VIPWQKAQQLAVNPSWRSLTSTNCCSWWVITTVKLTQVPEAASKDPACPLGAVHVACPWEARLEYTKGPATRTPETMITAARPVKRRSFIRFFGLAVGTATLLISSRCLRLTI
jgi:hypothetical protein